MARVRRPAPFLAALAPVAAMAFLAASSLGGPASASEVRLVPSVVGRGCCSAEHPPTLELRTSEAASEPSTADAGVAPFVELSGRGAPSGERGVLLVSPPLAQPIDLHNGGFLHVAPLHSLAVGRFTVAADGTWVLRRPLHDVIPAIEQDFVLEAAFVDPGMSIGYALSDAIQVRVESP